LSHFISMGKTAVLTTQAEHEGSAMDKYAVGRKLRSCGRVLEARCMTLEAIVAKLMWILSFARGEEAEKLFYVPVERDIF
ncbi:MAG TPA: L-asparaginase 1, partial [Candidatus Coproplasma excrementavium]|nr:L-asparaginase 1 [Candidatus Coproplasma excrementavium]